MYFILNFIFTEKKIGTLAISGPELDHLLFTLSHTVDTQIIMDHMEVVEFVISLT